MKLPELTEKMFKDPDPHWMKVRHNALVEWPGERTDEQEFELQKLQEWLNANEA